MTRLWRIAASIRLTVWLLVALSLLLLATVVVPEPLLGGPMSTNPIFLGVLALFYVNLAAVMIDRVRVIAGRMRVRVPTPEAADQWTSSPRALTGNASIDAAKVIAHLRGFGYRPRPVSKSSMYAVKHRYAAMGFILFHLSFFFLCAGGLLIWATRWVGAAQVVEGQSVEAKNARVLRAAPLAGEPRLAFTLERMTPTFDRGEATDLRAAIRFDRATAVEAWVNHPAVRGPWSLLVTDVGIAPVLWLQDARGFGIDRVAAPAGRSESVIVPLAAGIAHVEILPRASAFPSREELATLPLDVIVRQRDREVFRGTLRPGEAAPIAGGRIVFAEARYWAGMKLISERGGLLLVIGFVLATIGATWRLLLHRRDVVVAWSDAGFRVAGHGEWYAERDRRELMQLVQSLEVPT